MCNPESSRKDFSSISSGEWLDTLICTTPNVTADRNMPAARKTISKAQWGTWICRETFYASVCRASATGSVACSRGGHVDGQGSLLCRSIRRGLNLLCLSRAPQGLLLALWGTWIHKKTFDASLECHRVRSGYMEVTRTDGQGSLLCRTLER